MKVSPPGSDEETEVATSNGAIPTHWTALPLLPHSHTCLYTTYDSCFNFLFLLEVQNMSPGVLFIAESFVYIMLSLQCKMCTCSLAQNLLVWCVYGCAVLCSCPVWTGEWSDCAWNAALQGMLIGYLNQYKGVWVCVCASTYVCASMCVIFSSGSTICPPSQLLYKVTKVMVLGVHHDRGCCQVLGSRIGPLCRNGPKTKLSDHHDLKVNINVLQTYSHSELQCIHFEYFTPSAA